MKVTLQLIYFNKTETVIRVFYIKKVQEFVHRCSIAVLTGDKRNTTIIARKKRGAALKDTKKTKGLATGAR